MAQGAEEVMRWGKGPPLAPQEAAAGSHPRFNPLQRWGGLDSRHHDEILSTSPVNRSIVVGPLPLTPAAGMVTSTRMGGEG